MSACLPAHPPPALHASCPLPHPLQALDIADRVGTFELGKEFDALLVDTSLGGTAGPFDAFAGEDDDQRFEKFINLGDDRNIVEVYVQVGQWGVLLACMYSVRVQSQSEWRWVATVDDRAAVTPLARA